MVKYEIVRDFSFISKIKWFYKKKKLDKKDINNQINLINIP